MASSLNASTSAGLVSTADLSGVLQLQSNGTTIATISSTGVQTNVGAPAFSATMSTTQTLSNSTFTLINFDTKTGGNNFDTNSNFNTTTHLFTPTVAGYYQINISFFVNSGAGQVFLLIYKNGAAAGINTYFPNNVTAGAIPAVSGLVYCNGSTDYISA